MRIPTLVIVLLVMGPTACGDGDPSSPIRTEDARTPRDVATEVGETRAPGPPGVAITSPSDQAEVGASLRIEGTAEDDRGIASVRVAVGPNVAVPAITRDNYRHWFVDAVVPAGDVAIVATAHDVDGATSDVTVHVTRAGDSDVGAPTITIVAPEDDSRTVAPTLTISGTTSDDRGVVAVDVTRNGEAYAGLVTEDAFMNWSLFAETLPAVDNVFVLTARDAAGHSASATVTVHVGPVTDHTPPTLSVLTPVAGPIDAETVVVTGSASDAHGIREVKVRVGVDGVFGPYVAATTDDEYVNFSATVAIPAGTSVVQVRAFDTAGVTRAVDIALDNAFAPIWSVEETFPLRLRDRDPPTVASIGLTKDGVNAVMDEQLQRDITLLQLDPTGLLVGALDQLKVACGTGWQADDPDPHHDCTATALGRTFKGADGTWQSSPEFALVRLLTMTPANVVVEGTSVQGLQEIADGAILGLTIGGGFGQILAETLGIARTDTIISTAFVAAGLKATLVASHPNVHDGKVEVTLYDVMNDLSPLGALLGPVGDHPGVLDPSVVPKGDLLTPDFEMRLRGTSNLRYLEGVALGGEKDYLAILVDTQGPTYDDVLELDFDDPDAFDIVGMVEHPTLDLRFGVDENLAFVASCAGDETCKASLPGVTPPRPGSVWATPPWQLEHGVTHSGYLEYQARAFDKCYLGVVACLARVSVGQDGDPPGWIHFSVTGNLGNPPKDQYLWEMVLEVAQVALHHIGDTVIPEGGASVAFTLEDVDVGLTADGVEAAVRPFLEAEKHELGQRLFGDYTRNNRPMDLTYRRDQDGRGTIYFAGTDDPYDQDPYPYTTPGFFGDAALTAKVSVTTLVGSTDTTHEKLRLADGETVVYAQGADGHVYRLRFVATPDTEEVAVHVAQKLR